PAMRGRAALEELLVLGRHGLVHPLRGVAAKDDPAGAALGLGRSRVRVPRPGALALIRLGRRRGLAGSGLGRSSFLHAGSIALGGDMPQRTRTIGAVLLIATGLV